MSDEDRVDRRRSANILSAQKANPFNRRQGRDDRFLHAAGEALLPPAKAAAVIALAVFASQTVPPSSTQSNIIIIVTAIISFATWSQANSLEFLTTVLGQFEALANLAETQRLIPIIISSNALVDKGEALETWRQRLASLDVCNPLNQKAIAGLKKNVTQVKTELSETRQRYSEQQDAHVRLIQESSSARES